MKGSQSSEEVVVSGRSEKVEEAVTERKIGEEVREELEGAGEQVEQGIEHASCTGVDGSACDTASHGGRRDDLACRRDFGELWGIGEDGEGGEGGEGDDRDREADIAVDWCDASAREPIGTVHSAMAGLPAASSSSSSSSSGADVSVCVPGTGGDSVPGEQTLGDLEHEPGPVAPPDTTYAELQLKYRARLSEFFAIPDNYAALRRFVYHRDGPTVYSVLLYFVTRQHRESIIKTVRARDRESGRFSFVCPSDEYSRALKKFKKSFYNFEDKVGSGPLIWGNVVNPRFLVAPQNGSISLPLARLLALRWAIDLGLDTPFWNDYETVKARYTVFTQKKKKRYSNNHKRKRTALRKKVEAQYEEELRKRQREEGEEGGDGASEEGEKSSNKRRRRSQSRKPVRYTRAQRREIAELMEERKLAENLAAKKERNKHKARRSPLKRPVPPGVFCLPNVKEAKITAD